MQSYESKKNGLFIQYRVPAPILVCTMTQYAIDTYANTITNTITNVQ